MTTRPIVMCAECGRDAVDPLEVAGGPTFCQKSCYKSWWNKRHGKETSSILRAIGWIIKPDIKPAMSEVFCE